MDRQKILDEARREIDRIASLMAVIALLPDELPYTYGGYLGANEVCLRIPADIAKLRAFRKALGPDWRQINCRMADDADVARTFRHKNGVGRLLLWQHPNVEGATCHREQVGEETIPVYRIVCN